MAASILQCTLKSYQGTNQFIKDIEEMFVNILSNRYSVPHFFETEYFKEMRKFHNHYLFAFFLLHMFQTLRRLHIFVGKNNFFFSITRMKDFYKDKSLLN